MKSSLSALETRLERHVDEIARSGRPHFLYAHMSTPHHSHTRRQSAEELAEFRRGYDEKLAEADERILAFVDTVRSRDPGALVIVAADHGAWGLGSYGWATAEVLDPVADSLIALDQLGILLAIRWPSEPPEFAHSLRSTANLFRTVFAYLIGDEAVLNDRVADDGYITRGIGSGSGVFKAVEGGTLLQELVAVGQAD